MLPATKVMVLALLLSGCGPRLQALAVPPSSTTIGDVVEILANQRLITVTGQGSVRVAPDTATVTVALEQSARDANSAQLQVNAAGQAIISAWKAQGADDKSIQTVGLDLMPVYARPQATGEEILTGYKAVLRLQVRSTPETAGDRVDAALRAGANRLEGVFFSREDNTKARQEAIAKAIAKAMSEAKAALGPLDLVVKNVQRIDISGGSTPPRPWVGGMADRAMAMAPPTPIQPGELEVRAVVTVVITF